METLTYENALRLNAYLATCAVEAITYPSWTDNFKLSNLTNSINQMKSKYEFDPYIFTKEELVCLGFGNWDGSLLLVPLGLTPFIKQGTLLTGIAGNSVVVGITELDKDIRFGCIAFGVYRE